LKLMIKLFRLSFLVLPEDIYATVDSCEIAQEIWLRVQQMMKGSDIGIQEKKAKLFNEWEMFTSNEGELNESYYHRGIDVPTGSGSIPTASLPATIISTGSEVGPIASLIVTRRKGKEVMVESDTPKKKKLQEQIDAQVARELEEQQEKKSMRMNEQITRDEKVARIHAEEELQGMIDSLDKSNETISKYLQEYQDFA
nr:hypothetical protein [Tanacetum cinerariifolium]